ncbi:Uncharacterised protein [Bordetella pertussis]|nr:Uncharacterised protein [Bordetella pertussis]
MSWASSARMSRCCCVAASGTSRQSSMETGWPSGASKGMGWARRMNAASAWSRPLTRPCGTATPWPSAVEPSRSRENRLSNTTERANP